MVITWIYRHTKLAGYRMGTKKFHKIETRAKLSMRGELEECC